MCSKTDKIAQFTSPAHGLFMNIQNLKNGKNYRY